MSTNTALLPAVSLSTPYLIPDASGLFEAEQHNVALQPNLSAPGNQSIVPDPSPSH